MKSWKGSRILILGAARQGLALARFLARQGASVTMNDLRPEEKMQSAIQSLSKLPVRWVLGGHPLELLDEADVVCLSGGIPLTVPIVQEASRRGIPLTNDTQVFLELVPCPVIGITGSAGKTTTTTLLGRMAEAGVRSPARAWVGGNIGLPLIDFVEQIGTDDLVVLELSSFQLEQMTISPRIAAVLNITPNHLDRHITLEAYAAAKARILDFQHAGDTAVLSCNDPGAWALRKRVKGRLVVFGRQSPSAGQAGVYLNGENICLNDGQKETEIIPRREVLLRGDHNLLNVLAACAIAYAGGLPISAMRAGIAGFTGVAHRLEFVRKLNGISWYNDSIATAPERTLAAVHSFGEPLVLLLGGRDKNLPWETLVDAVHRRVDHVILFGEAAEKIELALGASQSGGRPFTIERCQGLQSAVQAAAQVARPGDVVLLSPGGTSYDEFVDFEERGERFREWVKQLT